MICQQRERITQIEEPLWVIYTTASTRAFVNVQVREFQVWFVPNAVSTPVEGGYLQGVIRRSYTPMSNPLPFVFHFDRKLTPFSALRIPLI